MVYLRAYLVADPAKGAIDTDGWNAAYREVFGTAANPTKPARSTVGVSALVNPLWLIEIEAFAVSRPEAPTESCATDRRVADSGVCRARSWA